MANEGDEFVRDGAPFDTQVYSDFRKAIAHETMETRGAFEYAASEQRAFVADTGNLTVSDTMRALLSNDSSDRLIVVTKAEVYNSSGSVIFAELVKNPTTDLPTTEQSYINLYSPAGETAPASVGTYLFDDGTVTMSGGDVSGVEITIESDGSTEQELVYFLEPGESIGFNAVAPGGLADVTAKVALFYFEVPL